ncbi:MAG: hypothetical protein AB8C95_08675 [Phycisphaeraceae bacterium]
MNLQDLRDWYDDLELRNKLEENQSIVVVGLIGLIIFSLVLVTCQMVGGGGSVSSEVKLVYFDVSNQSIRLVDHEYPAIAQSPLDGTTDVYLATIFSCEECEKGAIKEGMSLEDLKAKGMFVGWLEKIDPEMSEEMAMFGEGRLYRTVENDRWYKPTERGYEVINTRVYEKCARARPCMP